MEDATEDVGMEETELWAQWSSDGGSSLTSTAAASAATEPGHGPMGLVQRFSVIDYVLFSLMLAVSAAIGMYFAFCAKQKQNTTAEYLMGGKKMGIVPVSLSLIASLISGITLLGFSAEMYTYGTQFTLFHVGAALGAIPIGMVFMPVFYRLQLTSSYEYLERRFDRKVRLLGSILYIIQSFLYIPIVIYMPALAFSQVSGFNIHLISPVVCLVCIFYTSLGGMKAVVWTDSLQVVMMLGAMLVVICVGTHQVGGVGTVIQRNSEGGRFEFFNMSLDPTIRHTFWNMVIGFFFSWTSNCSVNQGIVQRFLAMPTIRRAQIMVILFTIGTLTLTSMSCYAGLLIYATYYDCDRLTAKLVRAPDQLLPYFVMDVARFLPGLPGLFIAGVFSAALSTMSTGLNAMSGVIYDSFIRPCFKVQPSEERASCSMKVICAVIGLLCVGMVFIVENLGTVVQLSISFGGVTSGPSLSLFVMGMFFPWANSMGVFVGGVTGLVVMGCISFGTQVAIAKGQIRNPRKPMSTAGCHFSPTESPFPNLETVDFDSITPWSLLNSTLDQAPATPDVGSPWPIFRLSYTLYCLIGVTVSVIVGMTVSFLTGPTRPEDVHIDLLTPVVKPLFSKRCRRGAEEEDEDYMWRRGEGVRRSEMDLEVRGNLLNKNVQKLNTNEDYIRGDRVTYYDYEDDAVRRPLASGRLRGSKDRVWKD